MKRGVAALLLILLSAIPARADLNNPTKRDRMKGQKVHTTSVPAPSAPVYTAEDSLYLDAIRLLQDGQYAQARTKLTELERTASTQDLKAEAAAAIGDSYFEEGKIAEASRAYRGAIDNYSDNAQTPYLQQRLAELRPHAGASRSAVASGPVSTVQVGSFKRARNANVLIDKLKTKGYDAFLNKADRMYRVRVGHFSTRLEAVELAVRLRKDGYPTKITSQ